MDTVAKLILNGIYQKINKIKRDLKGLSIKDVNFRIIYSL